MEGVQKVKQRRLLKRSTLEIITKILEDRRPFTSGGLAFATGIAPRTVSQTIKRFRCDGWIACDARYGAGRNAGRRVAYSLTLKGRTEAHAAPRKQASFTGGKWQIDAPIRSERASAALARNPARQPLG